MKIIIKEAGKGPEVKDVENTLEEFQKIVGGYIECVDVFDDILCVCNEEGKLRGLEPNFVLRGDTIVGDVFFCSVDGEDFDSLNDIQVDTLMKLFSI